LIGVVGALVALTVLSLRRDAREAQRAADLEGQHEEEREAQREAERGARSRGALEDDERDPLRPTPEGTTPVEPSSSAKKPFGPFRLVFHVNTGAWTNQIAIAPWGDVVAVGGHRARLLARYTGAELLALRVCFTQAHDAAAFVDDHRMILACQEEVQEITFPRGSTRTLFKFPIKMEHTAVGGGRVVAGVDGFWSRGKSGVTVYSIEGSKVVDTFDAGAKIEGVAISADGRHVAIGVEGPDIALRDVDAKETRKLDKFARHRHSALHFSPDARRLIADTGSFLGGEIDLETGEPRSSFETSSWISAVRYAGDAGVLATGANGLFLVSADPRVGTPAAVRVTRAPVRELDEGLDVSQDGSFLCAGGRSGDVACFSTKPVPPR
jgi:hypothetical protein